MEVLCFDTQFISWFIDILVNETGKNVKARILRIGPLIDMASSTIKVEAAIMDGDKDLMAGMTGITKLNDKSISGRDSAYKEENASSYH